MARAADLQRELEELFTSQDQSPNKAWDIHTREVPAGDRGGLNEQARCGDGACGDESGKQELGTRSSDRCFPAFLIHELPSGGSDAGSSPEHKVGLPANPLLTRE
jgi:hypothetical protein